MYELLSEKPLKEILNPRNTPEMGFQSYGMLDGNKDHREAQKAAFISGDIVKPELDYPLLDARKLDEGISRLESILSIADVQHDDIRGPIWDSASYRMAEMYWLKSAIRLRSAFESGDNALVSAAAAEYQRLNEELYGKPDKSITDMLFAEAFAQIDSKNLTEVNQKMHDELVNGFTIRAGDEEISVPALVLADSPRLPVVPKDSLDKLRNKLESEFGDIIDIVRQYGIDVVGKRTGDAKVYTPSDILNIFTAIHALRDPNNDSGVSIIEKAGATALSWDTSEMALIVGGRRPPIKSVEEVIAKVVHEYGWHCGRAVNGAKTEMPVLGTGVYSEAGPGESPDYLTFEEGIASISEKAFNADKNKWVPLDLERYAVCALAYNGYDFRQVFETLWRLRVLMLSKDGIDTSDDSIARAKRNTYTSCERIFRGTPTALARTTDQPITYNKDLAYLTGKLKALEFLDTATEDDLTLALKAKVDMTNTTQRELAEQYAI